MQNSNLYLNNQIPIQTTESSTEVTDSDDPSDSSSEAPEYDYDEPDNEESGNQGDFYVIGSF